MSSNSRVYTFTNDKVVNPNKLEIELNSQLMFWNNHEQGLQSHSTVWTGMLWLQTVVQTASGDYTVGTTETVIVINKGTGANTAVTLPSSPNTHRVLIVKDGKGDASTHNITITGNSKNIDGASTNVISTNFGAVRIVYNGTQWNVI